MRIDMLHPVTSARLMVIHVDATVRSAALSLSNPGIGLVVVCHGSGEAAGVVSKSDLVRHLTDSGPAEAPVAALMSRPIVSCGPDDDVHSVWQTMSAQGLQNVPVLAADLRPLGILDIRDAMKALFEQEEIQEHMLANYIAGIGYQ
jgi:CBS domain-containing protein